MYILLYTTQLYTCMTYLVLIMIIMHILTYAYHCLSIAPWSRQAELQFESPPPASEGEEIEVEASGSRPATSATSVVPVL